MTSLLSPAIPFVSSQIKCFTFFTSFKIRISDPLPPTADDFWLNFEHISALPGTQRKIMSMINKARLAALKSSFSRHSSDYARLVSLSSCGSMADHASN